jgi:hypothetical protein
MSVDEINSLIIWKISSFIYDQVRQIMRWLLAIVSWKNPLFISGSKIYSNMNIIKNL